MTLQQAIMGWRDCEGIKEDVDKTIKFFEEHSLWPLSDNPRIDQIGSAMVEAQQKDCGGYVKGLLLHIAKMTLKIYKAERCDQQE